MSHAPPPSPGEPFDLPIRTAPDWLRTPARHARDREPWYYGFLEKYALVVLWTAMLAFCLAVAAFLFLLFMPTTATQLVGSVVTPLVRHTAAVPGGVRHTDAPTLFAAQLVVALVVVAVGFVGFLLPILLTVAYLLLSVDAGRNLRALRRAGPDA